MIHDIEQGSDAWDQIRRGKLTASEAGEWLLALPTLTLTKEKISERLSELCISHKKSAKVGDLAMLLPMEIIEANQGYLKKDQEARHNTMCRMLGRELSLSQGDEFMGNRFTDFGHNYEDEAASAFEIETGLTTKKVGFVTLDGYDSFGCSPDRYVYDGDTPVGVLEIKCKPLDHSKIVIEGRLPPEHRIQVHFQMACSGFDRAWFYAFSPDMKPLNVEISANGTTTLMLRALATFDDDYRIFRDTNLPKLRL